LGVPAFMPVRVQNNSGMKRIGHIETALKNSKSVGMLGNAASGNV